MAIKLIVLIIVTILVIAGILISASKLIKAKPAEKKSTLPKRKKEEKEAVPKTIDMLIGTMSESRGKGNDFKTDVLSGEDKEVSDKILEEKLLTESNLPSDRGESAFSKRERTALLDEILEEKEPEKEIYHTDVLVVEEEVPKDKEIQEEETLCAKQVELINEKKMGICFDDEEFNSMLIRSCEIQSSSLLGCTIKEPLISNSSFSNCKFKYSEMEDGYLIASTFKNCNFTKVDFNHSRLDRVIFIDCIFDKNTSFENASLKDVKIIDKNDEYQLSHKNIAEILEKVIKEK